ncbi:MAG: quinol:cytochrome C oxidoreductase [Deltaproteobacteria bacterium]|nr:quinol:cytochrome C oxidoreductase [Deltaproteobacteria bacterium]
MPHKLKNTDLYIQPHSGVTFVKTVNLSLFLLTSAHFIVSAFVDIHRVMFNYLFSLSIVLSLILGGFFFTMLHHATKSKWSVVVRRISESFTSLVPFGVLLILPLLVGIPHLYEWSNAQHLSHDVALQSKSHYLNIPFFAIRSLSYMLILWFLYIKVIKPSYEQDYTENIQTTAHLWKWSCIGLFLFGLTVQFLSFDWLMSLSPHWFSTIFGVYVFSGCVVGGLSAMILVIALLRYFGYMAMVTEHHLHDLGKLLFGLNVFWAYIAFSQYMLIWYGNMPEETVFFIVRQTGEWKNFSLILPIGHFVIPFLFLISRSVKRNIILLSFGAFWLLLMHCADLFWLIMPNFSKEKVPFGSLEIGAFVWGLSLFLFAALSKLQKNALVPIRDPHLADSINFHQ